MIAQQLGEAGAFVRALDFEEGRLHLKDNAGELRWSNGEIEVLSRVVAKLPPQSRNFLDSHLT